MATLTVDLSSYDYANSTAVENASYPFSNAFAGSASTGDYARIDVPTGANAEVTSYYRFDLSALPVGATINSVVVKYKARISSTSYISPRTISVVSGTTVKGTAQTLGAKATDDKTFGQITGLSEAEVRALGIKLYAKRGASVTTQARYIQMYGATLTVDYTPAADRYYIRESGAWRQLSNPTFYKKVNGIWVQQSASPFTTTGKYERKNLLPDAYQQVDYLESDGTAYIITNFTKQPGVTVDMTAQFVSGFGALVGDSGSDGCYAGSFSTGYGINSSAYTGIPRTTKATIKVVFASTSTTMTVTTESTSESCSVTDISHTSLSNWYWCVFASDQTGNKAAKARIWSVEFSGAFSALLIPCYRKSDSELGLYDVVNNTFYTNAAGSGSFTTTTR